MEKQAVQSWTIIAALTFSFLIPAQTVLAAGAGSSCSKIGTLSGTAKKPLICKKIGKKLIWTSSKTVPGALSLPTTVPAGTVSQRNAVSKGASYLRSSSFSRSGLISQLQYEGFSVEDATYGTDAQNADWNAQAVKKGASYLRSSSFSRSGLISQLQYEGFSGSEATYGTDSQNADWNAQAAKKAASYLRSSSFSRSGLISQLLYEGFSQGQAEYGVGTTGL